MRQRPRSPEPLRILPATHKGFADGETAQFGQPGDLFWSRSGLGASVAAGNTAGWLKSSGSDDTAAAARPVKEFRRAQLASTSPKHPPKRRRGLR